jgi:hypothetical protein
MLFRTTEFSWSQEGETWLLSSSQDAQNTRITVEPENGFWRIFINGAPLNLRYSGTIGAQNDAWEFVKRHKRQFGSYRVKLGDKVG